MALWRQNGSSFFQVTGGTRGCRLTTAGAAFDDKVMKNSGFHGETQQNMAYRWFGAAIELYMVWMKTLRLLI